MIQKKVAVNTSTFAKFDPAPLDHLQEAGFEYSLNPHGRALQKEEIVDFCKGAIGMVAGTEPLDGDVLHALPRLKVISRCGVGMDNVDLNVAGELGIKVFNTPFGPTEAVAELTIGMTLNMLRKVNLMDAQIRSGVWKKQMGNLLRRKRIGIIGFGRIGQRVGELFSAFSTEIAYVDIEEKDVPYQSQRMELDSMLKWADIVSLHLSTQKGNAPVIGSKEIQKMKKGAWLVNLSRGGSIDEKALYDAILSGNISGAALDVFECEPYCSELKSLDHVVLTPHIGSYAKEARVAMEIDSVENLLEGLKRIK